MNPKLSDKRINEIEHEIHDDDRSYSDLLGIESTTDELDKDSEDARDEDTDSDSDWEETPPEDDLQVVFAILMDLSGRCLVFSEDELPIKFIKPGDSDDNNDNYDDDYDDNYDDDYDNDDGEDDDDDDDESGLDEVSDDEYVSIKRPRTAESEPLETPQLSDTNITRHCRPQGNYRHFLEYIWEWVRLKWLVSVQIRGDSRPRVRKRERVLAHLRRIAARQSLEEDENWPIQSRNRFRAKLQSLVSAETVKAAYGEPKHSVEMPPTRSVAEICGQFGDAFCVVCHKNSRDTMFVPCGHLSTCSSCCKGLSECPVCRRETITIAQISFAQEHLDCVKCGRVKDGLRVSCGHLSYCHECDENVTDCVVCKKKIMQRVKVLWSFVCDDMRVKV